LVHSGLRADVYLQTKMLRELGSTERRALDEPTTRMAVTASPRRERPRLMLLNHGDPRLASLQNVLGDLGYRCGVATSAEDALTAIVHGPVPDVLLSIGTSHGPHCNIAFSRECLARWPALRALYICFVPPRLPELLAGRESVLAAPFNAAELVAALAVVWPRADAESQ
jgi:hypothetical protein